ncbi:MAG TPA: S24 family peptidase [Candidatus Peribacteraceae bacterium]|nr:S24 family peptidase [Candidatus Peribacteraceae bacterium]
MKPLHRLQVKLLEVLRGIPDDESYSLEQMRVAIDASSKSQVVHHLQQLEKRGLIKRDPDNSAHFIVFGEEHAEDEFAFLPLLALASCGKGIENEQHVIERIPVRSSFIPAHTKETYLIQAEGDSMAPRIKDKDIVLVEKYIQGRHSPNGKVVVCEEEHECKIKRYVESYGDIVLYSFNEKYPPHVVKDPNNFQIHGIVRGVLFSSI